MKTQARRKEVGRKDEPERKTKNNELSAWEKRRNHTEKKKGKTMDTRIMPTKKRTEATGEEHRKWKRNVEKRRQQTKKDKENANKKKTAAKNENREVKTMLRSGKINGKIRMMKTGGVKSKKIGNEKQ